MATLADQSDASSLNRATLERFYRAFAARDGDAMAACYAVDATFHDPVFNLQGGDVGAMWRMLCQRGKDLRVEFSDIQCHADGGSANWQAWYTFSSTGRSVHNSVRSTFRMKAGLVLDQTDRFAFWRWSRQALGPAGILLGWTPLLKSKVRASAAAALRQFIAQDSNR